MSTGVEKKNEDMMIGTERTRGYEERYVWVVYRSSEGSDGYLVVVVYAMVISPAVSRQWPRC